MDDVTLCDALGHVDVTMAMERVTDGWKAKVTTVWDFFTYSEGSVRNHHLVPLTDGNLCCYALWGIHGGHSSSFSRGLLFVKLWLAKTAGWLTARNLFVWQEGNACGTVSLTHLNAVVFPQKCSVIGRCHASKTYINPFTATACKPSGLHDAWMRLQTVYIFRSYNIYF